MQAPESSTSTRSLGEIVGDISTDLSTLIHQEMDLAKSEMKQEVTKIGKGAGMFGGAGVAGLLTLIFLSLALTWLLDDVMPVELAALIVAVLWGIVAAVLAARGRKEIKEANPQLPITQQTLKEDAQWAKTQKA
ncbi:phage holin family protein [Nocardioides mesophilus]|uniref:Phage holin family protein n=1 Tax=Nocardioides mesophilus TaxID=433659 RepID=A0A7G9RHI0_9ACTN|nr:phage holin family protein [Nocardioides mesophilus]